MSSNYQLVAEMHKKFKLHEPQLGPRFLTKEEYVFRITAMFEELLEYFTEVFAVDQTFSDNMIKFLQEAMQHFELKPVEQINVENQFDALIDLAVFTIGTADRQNLPWDNGFERVIEANMQKELGSNGNKRGGFKRDFVKPEGWKPPILIDLIMDQAQVAANMSKKFPESAIAEDNRDELRIDLNKDQINKRSTCGLIILEGPDCSGKSTLADEIAKHHAGSVIHRTWSPELEKTMDQYLMDPINMYREGELMIIDRNVLTEWIYADVFRGGTNWNGFHRLALEKLSNLNALHVVCVPGNKTLWHNKLATEVDGGREEMHDSLNKLGLVYNRYKDIVSSEGDLSFISPGLKLSKWFHYDMQTMDVVEFAKSTVPYLVRGNK